MLLCPNCQQPVREQAKFCNSCGAALQTGAAPIATAQAAAPVSESAQPIQAPAASVPPSGTAPLMGKASPTGPISNGPETVGREGRAAGEAANLAPQAPEQPGPGAGAPPASWEGQAAQSQP